MRTQEFGFWTVNGSDVFDMMPAGIIDSTGSQIPIKLQTGNAKWGATHIQMRHGQWLKQNNKTVAEMVYEKLAYSAPVFLTEEANKYKIPLHMKPPGLLILRFIPNGSFLTVVSIYFKDDKNDGGEVGKYVTSRPYIIGPKVKPIFIDPLTSVSANSPSIIVPPIIIKKKRRF